jgi:DNA-binding transcriptional LysR family regulator
VRKLEDDLDVLLFDRRGHKARLTEAGEELLLQGRHCCKRRSNWKIRCGAPPRLGSRIPYRDRRHYPFDDLIPLIREFEQQECGTRLRISQEVLSGVWEAMASGRADLAIGAAYDGPETIRMQGEFQTKLLGDIDGCLPSRPGIRWPRFPIPYPPA